MLKHFNRKRLLAALGIILAAVLVVTAAVKIGSALKSHIKLCTLADAGISDSSGVTLIAHRGMSALAPENTPEAVRVAGETGFAFAEFDVRRTLDGVWVVMHDSDIKRMTDGEGEISELTYKQLLACRLDSGANHSNYDLLVVPTLDEMLTACAESSITPVIEIKQKGVGCVEPLLNYLGYRWERECRIISFEREQLLAAKKLLNDSAVSLRASNVQLEWITKDLSKDTLALAKENHDIAVSFNCSKAGSADEIKAFTAAGIRLAAWTVDKPARMKELYDAGVRQFTTNAITYDAVEEK